MEVLTETDCSWLWWKVHFSFGFFFFLKNAFISLFRRITQWIYLILMIINGFGVESFFEFIAAICIHWGETKCLRCGNSSARNALVCEIIQTKYKCSLSLQLETVINCWIYSLNPSGWKTSEVKIQTMGKLTLPWVQSSLSDKWDGLYLDMKWKSPFSTRRTNFASLRIVYL